MEVPLWLVEVTPLRGIMGSDLSQQVESKLMQERDAAWMCCVGEFLRLPSGWKLLFIGDLPIKHGDFLYISVPESIWMGYTNGRIGGDQWNVDINDTF